MTRIGDQLREDRALRDAAKEVFHQGVAHVRRESTPEAIGARIANRIGRKTDEVSDKAADLAEQHGAKAATIISIAAGVAALWWMREPIRRGIARLRGKVDDSAADDLIGQRDEDSDDE